MKNLRVKFIPGNQKKFIEDVYYRTGFSTKQLAEIVGVHQRSFIDWRHERLTMPLSAVEIFQKRFHVNLPEEKEQIVLRWKLAQKEANRKGGIAAFNKYGCQATAVGRSKGGKTTIAILRSKGIVPKVKSYVLPVGFNIYLAEYIGIMLGDGGLTVNQSTITLNSEADRDYINFVTQLGQKLFGEIPKWYKHKNDKAIILYYNGVSLVTYFTTLGLKIGNKVRLQVGVPDWIYLSEAYKVACLRGLMDTDGGIFLHKYKVKGGKYFYKKLSFTNRSKPLLIFVYETLKGFGFTPKLVDKVDNMKVWLYNVEEVERYLQVVGTNNPRLLK